jgi:PTH1 family peptidyl-tRNA hydrolase
VKYLIAGLGNIGKEYEHTRHNIGFDVADALVHELKSSFELGRLAMYSKVIYKGRQLHVIKPTTYVNLSGKAIRYWMHELKIDIENCFVVLDDLALPFGTLRVRGKGSDAGHNGLKSIQEELQRTDYPRLRFGIGNNFTSGRQVEYVLGQFSAEEQKALPERIQMSVEIVKSFCTIGLNNTMNSFNNR